MLSAQSEGTLRVRELTKWAPSHGVMERKQRHCQPLPAEKPNRLPKQMSPTRDQTCSALADVMCPPPTSGTEPSP